MGATLIRRGQPCTATLPGLRLIRHHDEVALLQSQLTIDLPQLHTDPATTRIAVHADSLATWVIPALAETSDMLFHLDIDDQDCSQDWLNAAKYPPPSPRPFAGLRHHPFGRTQIPHHRQPRLYRQMAPQRRNKNRPHKRPSPYLLQQRPLAKRVAGRPIRPLFRLPHPPPRVFTGLRRRSNRWPRLGHEPRTLDRPSPCHRPP